MEERTIQQTKKRNSGVVFPFQYISYHVTRESKIDSLAPVPPENDHHDNKEDDILGKEQAVL